MIAGVFSAAANATQSTSVKVGTLNVTGMTCAGCEVAVRLAAKSVDGDKDVEASYDKKNAEVTYDQDQSRRDREGDHRTVRL